MLCILWQEGFHISDNLPAAIIMADTEIHPTYNTVSHRRTHTAFSNSPVETANLNKDKGKPQTCITSTKSVSF